MKKRYFYILCACFATWIAGLCAGSRVTASEWQTTTQSFNGLSFQVQMPTPPKGESIRKGYYWSSDSQDNLFIVGAKPYTTRHDKSLKRRVKRLLRAKIISKGYKRQNEVSQDGNLHLTFVHPITHKFFLVSVFVRNNTIFSLLTETEYTPNHDHFIESFKIIDNPKPPCCACCAKKGSRCS